jgi:hypothetical protein
VNEQDRKSAEQIANRCATFEHQQECENAIIAVLATARDEQREKDALLARKKSQQFGVKAGEQTDPDLRSSWDCWARGANAVEAAIRESAAAIRGDKP